MNSDPYDSAAWRTFGMLDADESAIFDEAMRHDPVLRSAYLEMDRLSAAIAAANSVPIEPKAGQLERLESRLGLTPSRRAYLWLGLSGWAAAAALAILLVISHSKSPGGSTPALAISPNESVKPTPAIAENQRRTPLPLVDPSAPPAEVPTTDQAVADHPNSESAKDLDVKATVKVETKRLIQEIEVLRDNLEKFQHRDRVLFEPVAGMALPIVMRMAPPGLSTEESANLASSDENPAPITAMLGDALRVMTLHNAGKTVTAGDASVPLADPSLPPPHPTAIPIYDAARDAGTLVVSNLPTAEVGKVYNLWVTTATGEKPIYVGSLPENSASGADSFDFSLGSNMVLPSGFVLTKDPLNVPSTPTSSNTVLEGPPTPGR